MMSEKEQIEAVIRLWLIELTQAPITKLNDVAMHESYVNFDELVNRLLNIL